jgi:hypothetical protein
MTVSFIDELMRANSAGAGRRGHRCTSLSSSKLHSPLAQPKSMQCHADALCGRLIDNTLRAASSLARCASRCSRRMRANVLRMSVSTLLVYLNERSRIDLMAFPGSVAYGATVGAIEQDAFL